MYATVRSPPKPDTFPKSDKLRVLQGIDVSKEEAGKKIVEGLEKGQKVDGVWIVAGLLVPEVSAVHSHQEAEKNRRCGPGV